MSHGGKHVMYSKQIHDNAVDTSTKEEQIERFKMVAYIKKLNKSGKRYGAIADLLEKEEILGRDGYPTTMAGANQVIATYGSKKNTTTNDSRGTDGNSSNNTGRNGRGNNHRIQLTQRGKNDPNAVAGTNGQTYPGTKCYNCNRQGHIST